MATAEITEAREALDYWSRRASTLPWHRRAARREARELAARWRVRLVNAHLDRWGAGGLARWIVPLMDTRGRSRGGHVRALVRRTPIGRTIMFTLSAVTFGAIASVALLAVIAIELLPS
jgi:hypothetical protein